MLVAAALPPQRLTGGSGHQPGRTSRPAVQGAEDGGQKQVRPHAVPAIRGVEVVGREGAGIGTKIGPASGSNGTTHPPARATASSCTPATRRPCQAATARNGRGKLREPR